MQINTGVKRAYEIEVIKKDDNDSIIVGYPRLYDLRNSFLNYKALTTNQISVLSESNYRDRLNSFIAFVETREQGLQIANTITNSDSVLDNSTCPMPNTPTLEIDDVFLIRWGMYDNSELIGSWELEWYKNGELRKSYITGNVWGNPNYPFTGFEKGRIKRTSEPTTPFSEMIYKT